MYRALIVCNSTFPEDPAGLPDLEGPKRDGLVLWRALVDEKVGLFPVTSAMSMFERTAREITMASEEFFGEASEEDLLLFYYSGHGKRADGDLYLAARDSLSDHVRSTAVSSQALSKMMSSSAAGAIVVLLDCCHAGAFKGDDLGQELSGEGRFVLAACRAPQLARDSEVTGQPSPFTSAIVDGLLGRSSDDNRDGQIDIDELEKYVTKRVKKAGSAPFKSFDGSGSPVLARAASRLTDSRAFGQTNPRVEPVAPNHGATVKKEKHENAGSVAGIDALEVTSRLAHRLRAGGDYSVGDIRSWMPLAVIGVLSGICSLYAFKNWARVTKQDASGAFFEALDPMRFAALVAASVAVLVLVYALAEGFLLRGALTVGISRRAVVATYERRGLKRVRVARDGAAVITLGLLASSLLGVENYSSSWIAALSMLTVVVVISIVSHRRYGDSTFLTGALMVLFAAFLPSSDSDAQSSLSTAGGVVQLVMALLLIVAWSLRATSGWLLSLAVLSGLSLVTVLYSGESISVWVATTGVVLAVCGALLGCGRSLDQWEGEERTSEGMLATRSTP